MANQYSVHESLAAALQDGSLSVADGCRAIRALHGLSQAQLAELSGLSIKVVKSLESGKGNPRLSSLQALARVAGLKIAFVQPAMSVGLFKPSERVADESRRREADYAAVASGRQSERERDASNALRIGEVHVEWPDLE